MNRWLAGAIACTSVFFAVGTARAQERKGSNEVSEFLSWTRFSTETSLMNNPGVGLRFGHNFTEYVGLELTYHRSDNAEFEFVKEPLVDLNEVQAVAIFNWKRFGKKFGTRFQPYIGLGVGYEDFSPRAGLQEKEAGIITKHEGGNGVEYQESAAHVDGTGTYIWGVGTRFYFTENVSLRLDLRASTAIAADFTDFTPSLGLSFLFGGTGGRDSDRDGVIDFRDDCPDTPEGAWVTPRGCPTDEDADKVFDGIDKCPGTPAGVVVDAAGCPVDSDGDGVPDGIDQCASTPQGAKVDEKGCPLDEDGDGVADGIDQCPSTPKGATVDAKGCPTDADADGVADGIDQCPKTPKGAQVDDKGCPLDSDGDGVFDGIDECPDTPAGLKVDKKGCPPVAPLFQKDEKVLILKGVTFDTDKATLKPEATAILDGVAASLLAYPAVRVEVQGHTDSTGGDAHNMKLSQARAEAVRDYLVGKGVAADRLQAKGYGETKPVAPNETAAGRSENRRVELDKLD